MFYGHYWGTPSKMCSTNDYKKAGLAMEEGKGNHST